jgi:hypothetical protein
VSPPERERLDEALAELLGQLAVEREAAGHLSDDALARLAESESPRLDPAFHHLTGCEVCLHAHALLLSAKEAMAEHEPAPADAVVASMAVERAATGLSPGRVVDRLLEEVDRLARSLRHRDVQRHYSDPEVFGPAATAEARGAYLARMEFQLVERLEAVRAGRALLQRCEEVLRWVEAARLPAKDRAVLRSRVTDGRERLLEVVLWMARLPG